MRVARTRLFGFLANVFGQPPGPLHQSVGRQDLGDEPKLERLLRRERLPREQEIARAVHAEQQRINNVHAIARNQAPGEVRGILELRSVGGQHDIGEQRQFGMSPGRSVHRADDWNLDIEEVHQPLLTFGQQTVDDLHRRPCWKQRVAGIGNARTAKLRTGSGEDDHLGVVIVADIVEGERQFPMRQQAPLQGAALGVQRHLQDAVAAFHLDEFVLAGVVGKFRHLSASLSA